MNICYQESVIDETRIELVHRFNLTSKIFSELVDDCFKKNRLANTLGFKNIVEFFRNQRKTLFNTIAR